MSMNVTSATPTSAANMLFYLINMDSGSHSGHDDGDGGGKEVSLRRMYVTFFRMDEGS